MSTAPLEAGTSEPTCRQRTWVGILILLSVVYMLSEAPVFKFRCDPALKKGTLLCVIGDNPVYRPVHWLMINSPLRHPLIKWAEVCGVRYAEITPMGRAKIIPWC